MKVLSCAFNMDTACVELKFDDGSMIAIDNRRGERGSRQYVSAVRVGLSDYNDRWLCRADTHGDPETYLKTATEYKPLDS